jgi:hypothetical protein
VSRYEREDEVQAPGDHVVHSNQTQTIVGGGGGGGGTRLPHTKQFARIDNGRMMGIVAYK